MMLPLGANAEDRGQSGTGVTSSWPPKGRPNRPETAELAWRAATRRGQLVPLPNTSASRSICRSGAEDSSSGGQNARQGPFTSPSARTEQAGKGVEVSANSREFHSSASSVEPEPPLVPHLRSRASVSHWVGGSAHAPFVARLAGGYWTYPGAPFQGAGLAQRIPAVALPDQRRGLRPLRSDRRSTAPQGLSTNRSLGGRCAANFRGVLCLHPASRRNTKRLSIGILLSTGYPQERDGAPEATASDRENRHFCGELPKKGGQRRGRRALIVVCLCHVF